MSLTWNAIRGYLSEPEGVSIIATAEHARVELGDRLIVEMRLHRPDHLALVDEAVVSQITDRGPASYVLPLAKADEWAKGMRLHLPGGTLPVGERLLEVWREHVTLARAAREQASKVAVIEPVRRPLVVPGRRA